MFVKTIFSVVLLCAVSNAQAQADLKESYANAREYLATVRSETESMVSFSHNEGLEAIRRGLRQFKYMDSELKYLKSKLSKETENEYYRLETVARETEEILSQSIALAVTMGAIKSVAADLAQESKIENPEVSVLPEGRSISRGEFSGFSTRQILYDVGMGLSTTTKALTMTYDAFLKGKKEKIQIRARVGSHVRHLEELKSLMESWASFFNIRNGEFFMISGLARHQLKRFILFGNDVNFSSLMKANSGWISRPPFFSYRYGVAYIGEVQMLTVVPKQQ